jgi:hypothetical protein
MSAERLGLLRAYLHGDLLARKALLDLLEEDGDPRAASLRHEAVDWNKLARRKARTPAEFRRFRWLIDCARVGSGAPPEVVAAVREARRRWLQPLFPEFDLSR